MNMRVVASASLVGNVFLSVLHDDLAIEIPKKMFKLARFPDLLEAKRIPLREVPGGCLKRPHLTHNLDDLVDVLDVGNI